LNRLTSLVRAQLSGEVLGERTPVAALAMQVVISGLLCAVVRGEVGGFGYAVFALSLPLALTTVPLLGELAPLLRADPATEWVGALPVTPRDLRLSRVMTLLLIMGALAAASLIPAALLAPDTISLVERPLLVVMGVLQTWTVAAGLLLLQVALGRGGDTVMVALQTILFVAIMIGVLVGLRSLGALAAVEGPTGPWLLLPPAWFAAPFATSGAGAAAGVAAASTTFAAAVLALAPFPPAPRARSTRSILGTLLAPARAAAERLWVTREERGAFGFVFEALPAEREFVVRTYPLVAAPLLLVLLGADASTVEGEGLYALLLFAPGAYLPFILMHVPTSATPAARWIIDTSPTDPLAEDRGARKAVAVRLLLPLYLAMGGLVAALASPALALRLWPLALASGLLALKVLWRPGGPRPLSTKAQDLLSTGENGLGGDLLTVAIAMTLLAAVSWQKLQSSGPGWALLGAMALIAMAGAARSRARSS
jgi:hypothetical protein